MKKVKLLSLFSGIGAFEKALDKLEREYELVNYCEIDKYASKSYSMIHECDESLNLGDITKIDTSKLPNDIDILTYGFPCQDISLAGKQKGFEADGERTRSGLFFEALRIIEEKKPKVAIAENVKNLTSKKFKKEFEIVLSSLEEVGYTNYWKILNAKDYGTPQNRERVFIISIRNDLDTGLFNFPTPFELKLRLKDMLEDEVDEKYFLSDEQISKILSWKAHQKPFEKVLGKNSICPTLTARGAGENHSGMILFNEEKEDTSNMQEFLMIREATKKGYAEAYEGDSVNLEHPNSKTRRGRVGKQVAQTLTTSCNQGVVEPCVINPLKNKTSFGWHFEQQVFDENGITRSIKAGGGSGNIPKVIIGSTQKNAAINFEGICPALTSAMGVGGGHVPMHNYDLRIRKLTPLECFRLMGFEDDDFNKITDISNSQLYKQAGNSIVVDVLENIFKELFKAVDFEEKEIIKKPLFGERQTKDGYYQLYIL